MKTKKLIAAALVFIICLGLCPAVFADVAYMPMDDFYAEHAGECQYENRYYYTNGPEGFVLGYSSPTGSAKISFPNGLEYYVSYTWSDGERLWGCIEYDPETLEIVWWKDGESAWVDMDAMVSRYDSEAFIADHADEIQEAERSLDIGREESAFTYLYPGSGILTEGMANYSGDELLTVSFSKVYTDAEGREWGYCGYHYGARELWVCLSDPYTQLPAGAEYTQRELIPAAGEELLEDSLSEAQGLGTYSALIAVAIVIMASALAAYIIIKRRRG